MDLTYMMKEASLADHSWQEDGIVRPGDPNMSFDFSAPNDIKGELEQEWGLEDQDPVYSGKEYGVEDGDSVIMFARDMMNRGATATSVDRALKKNFTKEQLRCAVDGLKDLFSFDGIIGRFVIDARGYDSCKQALKAVKSSKYKRHIGFVMGCTCGDPHMIPTSDDRMEPVASTGNAADDFLSDDSVHEVKNIAHCPSSRIRLFESSELGEEWMDDTLISLIDISGMPEEEVRRIRKLDKKPIKRVQAAFRWMDKMSSKESKARYSEPVNANEYVVDIVNHAIQPQVALDREVDATPLGHIDPTVGMIELEIDKSPEPQIEDLQISDAGDFTLFPEKKTADELAIEAATGDSLSQEMPGDFESLDVEIHGDQDEFFAGCDVIELEEERTPPPDLGISIKSEIEW